MLRLPNCTSCDNVYRVAYISAVLSSLLYWYLRLPHIVELFESHQLILDQNHEPPAIFPHYNVFYPQVHHEIVLVFVHIQKTGGTSIEKALTKEGVLGFPCQCNTRNKFCSCKHDHLVWLFSRFSVGWKCGLHADFTELRECVPLMLDKLENQERPRKFVYFTILRDPIHRYLSEWFHTQRHGSWKKASLRCNGLPPTPSEYSPCPHNPALNMSQLSFYNFANCPRSLSNNRQTRMIASLNDLGCYSNLDEWTRPANFTSNFSLTPLQLSLLSSAIENLAVSFSVFGLIEHATYTQYMYRMVLGLVFRIPFTDRMNESRVSGAFKKPGFLPIGWEQVTEARNQIDMKFVAFARQLFAHRLAARLRTESILPTRLRLLLRVVEPHLLLSDTHLGSKVCRYLSRFFEMEVAKAKWSF